MNALQVPQNVVLTQSAKTCRGGTSAAACLVSLLPPEIPGARKIQVISPVQTSMNASTVESAQSILSVPTLWEATVVTAKMDSSLTTFSVKRWINVPIPELARSMRPATTVLEATLVSAIQDLNPAVETGVSMAQGECVKMWMNVPETRLFVVPMLSAPTSRENTIAPACLDSFRLIFGPPSNQRLSNVQILMSARICALSMQHAPIPLGATFVPVTLALHQAMDG